MEKWQWNEIDSLSVSKDGMAIIALCRFELCRAPCAGQATLSGGRGPGAVAGGPP